MAKTRKKKKKMQIKSNNEISHHPVNINQIQKTDLQMLTRMWRKRNIDTLCVEVSSQCGKQYGYFLKLGIDLLYDAAFPQEGVHPKD